MCLGDLPVITEIISVLDRPTLHTAKENEDQKQLAGSSQSREVKRK